jgi:diguanylate cyclase (GGDEF)-like protein
LEGITVQEKKENQILTAVDALVPEIYMPRLQFFVRMMLGAMAAVYFNYLPIPLLILTVTQINLVIISYCVFHVCWWWYYQRYGAKMIMFRLGAWIDIMGATVAALCDPVIIPPMMLLFLIASLGNGIQHGLYVFVESMIGAFILGLAALFIHYSLLDHWPPFDLYFYVFLIVVGVSYSYLLVRRNELMRIEAIRMSEHDSLTGILNRRAFLRTAEYLLFLNERALISLVFIFADLDNFKAVNDQFGHDMGDKVLRQFADMAQLRFRKSDIIARYGGDEFVMILTNTSLEDAELGVQKLQSDFRDWARNNGLQVGSSFGLGMAPEGRNNLGNILRQVDTALYDAKLNYDHISKVIIVKTKNVDVKGV